MSLTVREIAERIGGQVEGDASARIDGAAGVREAMPGEISFVSQARYADYARASRASAVIVGRDWKEALPAAIIRVDQPEAAFAEVAKLFAPPPVQPAPGIHPSAVIAKDAKLGQDVSIGAYCVVEPGAVVGDRTVFYAGCYVGHGVRVGKDCKFYAHVSLREHIQVGDRAIMHDGVVVGSDGFGYNVDKAGVRHKIPQIGIVVIGDDVEIGANTTIDRARFGKTRIGNGVKIDNLVQIGHNVIIGDHSVIVAQVGIAGSTILGKYVTLAGQVGVVGHVVIHDGAVVGAQSGISKDVPAKAFMFGSPADTVKEAAEMRANVHRLPVLKQRVADLEKRIADLEKRAGS